MPNTVSRSLTKKLRNCSGIRSSPHPQRHRRLTRLGPELHYPLAPNRDEIELGREFLSAGVVQPRQ